MKDDPIAGINVGVDMSLKSVQRPFAGLVCGQSKGDWRFT